MSRPKQRIYTLKDWNDADPLDRLYMHLMEPDRWALNESEENKFDILSGVWKIMVKKASPRERIRLISRTYDCTDRCAFKYVQEATKLFLETLDVDHELELRLAYHRFMKIHDKARDNDKTDDTQKALDVARRALESAMKVREQLEQRQPKALRSYAEVMFTDDPKALRARNTEDIEFEDLSHAEEDILELETVGIPTGDKAL
jgi:hypothetical protein